jgi:hypothetical protein
MERLAMQRAALKKKQAESDKLNPKAGSAPWKRAAMRKAGYADDSLVSNKRAKEVQAKYGGKK